MIGRARQHRALGSAASPHPGVIRRARPHRRVHAAVCVALVLLTARTWLEAVPPASHTGALPGRGRCGRRPGHGRRGSLTPAESSLVKTFRNLFLVSRGTNVASVLAVEAGLSLTAGLLQGQREDPRHGRGPAARGVRDGPGRKCSCRATSRAGSRDPGGVPAPASHAGWGIDWRAADAADREVAADAAKGARWCTSALMPRIRSGWSGPAVSAGVLAAAERTGALLVVLENLCGYGPAGGQNRHAQEKEKGSWVSLTRR